jgi:TolB protein
MRIRVIFLLFSFFLLFFSLRASPDTERIYIDITSPSFKKVPIAIQQFIGLKDISEIIKDDLSFTGFFECLDENAFLEKPDQPFNYSNWKSIGATVVVKGRVIQTSEDLRVSVSVYDVLGNQEILKKEYSGPSNLLRLIAHSISNNIYEILTGQKGIFKSKIAFVAGVSKKELYIMDWDGHRITPMGIKGDILLSPKWSRDKTKLTYSVQKNRIWNINIIDLNTKKERILISTENLIIVGNFYPGDRKVIFSSVKDGKSTIYTTDIENDIKESIISSRWIDVSPSISPDGNHILFVSNRSGGPQIYISTKNGEGIRRLTFDGSYNTSPAWSPMGDRIAFVKMINGRNQIFIMKPDGSEVTQLTDKGNNEDPSFSPDGRHIAFTSDRDGKKGIFLMKANGLDQKRITPKDLSAQSPNWSTF